MSEKERAPEVESQGGDAAMRRRAIIAPIVPLFGAARKGIAND